MGPFPSPASFSFKSQAYSLTPPSNPVALDVVHTFTFAAGSGVGATIFNSLTPTSTLGGAGGTAPAVCDDVSADCSAVICYSVTDGCTEVTLDTGGPNYPMFDPSGIPGTSGGPPVTVTSGGCSDPTDINCTDSPPGLDSNGPPGYNGITIQTTSSLTDLSSMNTAAYFPHASAAGDRTIAIELATPFQSAAASYTASASCPGATATCWITVPVPGGNIAPSSRTAITAIANTQGLPPGTYTSNVAITITPTGQSPATLSVPVTLALALAGPKLAVSPSAVQFFAQPGAISLPAQTLGVSNSGSGSLNFTATASALAGNWLTVTPSSGTSPAQISVLANPTGLAPGTYSGLIQFTGSGAVNGSQAVEVTLTVSTTATVPSISSSALVFVSTAGAIPAAQTVTLFNPTSQPLTPSASIAYASGDGWFTATSSGSTVTSTQPLTETIAVNPSGLTPGVYLGSIDVHLAETNTDYPVAVLLLVKTASCTPTHLFPMITNLGGGFQATAGIPVPLSAQVVDDCGTPFKSGAVTAYFPGGDPLVSLTPVGQGQWSGTWLPHSIATGGPVTVGIVATSYAAPLYGSAGVIGTLAANAAMPLVFSGGAVSSASYAVAPLAPGSRISIFGSNLAGAPVSNNTSPYPPKLGGTQVLLGGEALPLQVVAPGLINAIVPYDSPIGVPQQLIVQQGESYSMPEPVVLGETQPSVFTQNQTGQGPGVIVEYQANGAVLENTPANPASAGDLLVIYCTGLGAVAPAVPAGTAAPLSTLSYASSPVTVTIGGISVPAAFAGLAPEFVGAYQVNVTVPSGIEPGPGVPLIVSSGGASSVPVTVAIQ